MRPFLSGFLATLGVLWPYFGHSIDIYGIHNRIIGWSLLALATILAFTVKKANQPNTRDLLLISAIMATILCYSTWDQLAEIMWLQPRMDYTREKTAITIQVCLPPIIAGYVLSRLRSLPTFWTGIRIGAVTAGVLALGVVGANRHMLLGQTLEMKYEFAQGTVFAAACFSVILSMAVLALLTRLHRAPFVRIIPSIILLGLLCACLIVVQQRAHLVTLAVIGVAIAVTQGSLYRNLAILLLIGAFVTVTHPLHQFLVGPSVVAHWDSLMAGEPLAIRWDAIRFAIDGFMDAPLGHGYGAFAAHYPEGGIVYPHNILMEAGYELGILGFLLVGVVIGLAVYRFYHSLKTRIDPFPAAILLFITLHLVKSSDLAGTDLLWFCLLLSRPECLLPGRRVDVPYQRFATQNRGHGGHRSKPRHLNGPQLVHEAKGIQKPEDHDQNDHNIQDLLNLGIHRDPPVNRQKQDPNQNQCNYQT